MDPVKNVNFNFLSTLEKINRKSKIYTKFINETFNCFLQFYNSRKYFRIFKLKEPNKRRGINAANVIVQDKLKDTIDKYYAEAPKIEDAVMASKLWFLKETLLPFPPKLEYDMNLENPSSGYRWDSQQWIFEGFCVNIRRPTNMAHTVVNITDFGLVEDEEKGTKDLFFRTFWKPHDLPWVPKGYYDPLWVYAGDFVPLKDS
ncbi:unnamed protein product [Brachionus calyciflorus]|uniref:Uncharacterized protein n=1 Tax=Brachionus calyciflorus TaxID=104777 RepID=A0A814BIG6_9BILA|nr:unnamed protein product [Brachionus calyciflorus]